MKILMLTPYLPYPPSSGGQVRSYNLIKQLYKKHDITLFCYIRSDAEKKYIPELKKYCKKVEVFKRRRAWSPLNIFLAGVSPYPFLVSIYLSPSLKRTIQDELKSAHYDLIHSETFYVMPNIPNTKVPIFLVEQTIEYLVYQRFVEMLPLFLLPVRLLLFIDVFKIRWWEKNFWNKAKRLAAMSQEDKRFMLKSNPNLKIDVVANGVDMGYFTKTKKEETSIPTVLFVGQFKWLPNKDAATFLAYDIWPLIKKEALSAKLLIVGRDPTPEILALREIDGVEVLGNVDDIRRAYAKASVLLAPIRNGRGTKYKILEAMATKTPIVGTPLAIEGIDLQNNRDVLIGETKEELARLTLKVIRDHSVGKKLADRAFMVVAERYDWSVISAELDRVYKDVAKSEKEVVSG